jgi:hypothetical protein
LVTWLFQYTALWKWRWHLKKAGSIRTRFLGSIHSHYRKVQPRWPTSPPAVGLKFRGGWELG